MQRRHWLRLAWWKWHRLVRMERLEEELIAYRCVLWTHRIDKLIERQARRDCRVILAVTWVRWRHWHRRQRCSAWRRGLTLAMRRCFDAWKRYSATLRLQSIERRELVAVIVGEIINATLTLVEKPSVESQSTRRDLLLMKWTQAASQQALAASFSHWRSMLKVVASPTAKLDDICAPMSSRKKLSYPQRFALEYKTRRRAKPTRPHRPAWR
ncbi:hypothetical protein Poli38472_001736 [Pythium oligandrum]|uniref:Uncharacterized protein n=1 Tax=Pythium oligandrum TaxID=41045 RepID=A0A8K1CU03_PYTOL|nr:hypothetical protein Poli38472_001736 [Pythium oligandrum]|eukprot:TMW69580.1 hypothetical protein Poli38472_001736 [Pythium oligandrum]